MVTEKTDEMIGKIFGSLTVIARAPKNSELVSRCIRYTCKCECGKIVEVNGNSLRTGHTSSCGCARKGKNIIDLTNRRFGALTAISNVGVNCDRRAVWMCQCDCGNKIEVSSHLLLDNKIKSCGCLKESLGEKKISDLLGKMGYCFTKQYKISDCKIKHELPFDFAIFRNDILVALIEYQGDIHYVATGGWNTTERLKENQKRDAFKKKYCEANNIPLFIIPYWDYDKLDEEYLRKGLPDGL